MKFFCEFMVKEMFPCIRAMITKELISNHGINQSQAAELLGITQPAVSQYMRQLRGRKELLENDAIKRHVKEIAEGLYSKSIDKKELERRFCGICDMLSRSK